MIIFKHIHKTNPGLDEVIFIFDSNKPLFVFKQSDNNIQSLRYEDKYGLIFSGLTPGNHWSDPYIIKKDIHPAFNACIDNSNRIIILFQDHQGNLSLLIADTKVQSFSEIPVLKSKQPTQYDKYLNIIPIYNSFHIFYVLRHRNSLLLTHQIYSDKSVSNPAAVDYISQAEGIKPFSISAGSSGSIYAFYTPSDGKNTKPGFKKFMNQHNAWSEFSPLTGCTGNCKYISLIHDRKDILHISCQCTKKSNGREIYKLIYMQKIQGRNLWTDAVILHSSVNQFKNMHLLYINNELICYWVRNDIIYYCFSEDNGKTWARPSRSNFNAGRQLLSLHYRTNIITEKDDYIIDVIPGTLAGGFKMAFYKDKTEKLESLSFNDFKTFTVETIEEIKGNMEKLQVLQSELKEKLFRFETLYKNTQKELAKNNIRIELIEKKFREKN